jgi:PKD domain
MKNLKLFNCLVVLGALLLLGGCSKDDSTADSGPKPKADFTFTNVGTVFTFKNLSEDGAKYRWDFGDLRYTSNEKDPVYKYKKIGGKIIVSLTVTNASGAESFVVKEVIAPEYISTDVKIDGDFAEWAKVKYASESTTGNGSIQKVKIYADDNNVSVYLEGNKKMKMELVDMLINSDGDDKTGFKSWQWPKGSGADFLFEGPLVSNSWGNFFTHNDPAGGWGWKEIAGSGAKNMKSSGLVSIDDTTNAIEFSIPKTQLGTLGSSIGFAFLELTAGWGSVANFPEVTDKSAFAKIDL